jgi:hypothetical protein
MKEEVPFYFHQYPSPVKEGAKIAHFIGISFFLSPW